MEALSEFCLDIQYRPGKQAVVPDALSRPPEGQVTSGDQDSTTRAGSGAGTSAGALGALTFEPSWFA